MSESAFPGIVILVLIVVFLVIGGGLHPSQQAHVGYTTSLSASSTISTDGASEVRLESATTSQFAGKIRLAYGNPAARDPNQQYVVIESAPGNAPISITGWRIQSAITGRGVTIGYGATLPTLGGLANENIVLNPGEYAYVISGSSPEGLSFRDNACTGYFAMNQRFYPGLSGSCPRPAAPAPYQPASDPNGLPIDCQEYAASIPYCAISPAVPQRYALCADYVSQHFSYQGCVADFKNDSGFYLNHWFVYENQNEPVWQPGHETLALYDSAGKEVDALSY